MNQQLHIQDTRSRDEQDSVLRTSAAVLAAFVVGLAVAEIFAALSQVVLSCCAHGLLILALLDPAVLDQQGFFRRLRVVLALIPLTRLISIVLSARQLPLLFTYAILTALLLVAIGTATQVLDFSLLRLGLRLWSWPTQLLVALSGLPLSLAAFLTLRPQLQSPALGGVGVIAGTMMVLSVSALAEELLFRGMLQQILKEVFGEWGLVLGAGIFALSYASWSSWTYVLFLASAGLFFGWCAHRTGSIHGVALAHGITLVGAVYVWPFVIGELNSNPIMQSAVFLQFGVWLCVALLLGLAGLMLIRLLRRAIAFLSRRLHHS
jgi:membrane protease YdiL (CAAX protease family)